MSIGGGAMQRPKSVAELVANSSPVTYVFTRETIKSFNNKSHIPLLFFLVHKERKIDDCSLRPPVRQQFRSW